MAERLDPEMLKNIDLLLSLEVLESESEWDLVEDMETVDQASRDDKSSQEGENENE